MHNNNVPRLHVCWAQRVDPRQQKAQKNRFEKKKREWKAWEESIEREEALYRRSGGPGSRERANSSGQGRTTPLERQSAARSKGDSLGSRFVGERQPKDSLIVPQGQSVDVEQAGSMYSRQRLLQKVNTFSRMVHDIQQAQQTDDANEPHDTGMNSKDRKTIVERRMQKRRMRSGDIAEQRPGISRPRNNDGRLLQEEGCTRVQEETAWDW